MDIEQPIQFTGIVVTYNEARRLRECLNSLAFCEQLLVIDLGSEDRSVEIAQECGADIVHHNWVPVVEKVWPDVLPLARNHWIIRADPDEVMPDGLIKDIKDAIREDPSIGVINVPYQYYFLGQPLNVSIWGGIKSISKVFHKDRVELTPNVHRGVHCPDGHTQKIIESKGDNAVRHYWVDSYRQLLKKHWRYIKEEGVSRYNSGHRFRWKRWGKETWRVLKRNLINYDGLRGGFRGIFLSFFYAWYINMSLLSLRHYQKQVEKSDALSNHR